MRSDPSGAACIPGGDWPLCGRAAGGRVQRTGGALWLLLNVLLMSTQVGGAAGLGAGSRLVLIGSDPIEWECLLVRGRPGPRTRRVVGQRLCVAPHVFRAFVARPVYSCGAPDLKSAKLGGCEDIGLSRNRRHSLRLDKLSVSYPEALP
jgi:hypothetical protein